MKYTLSLTGRNYEVLKNHLFQGDQLEAVALILCHRSESEKMTKLVAHKIVLVSNADCRIRSPHKIVWNTKKYLSSRQIEILDKGNLSLLTIHSHPSGFDSFSILDNENDKSFFSSVNHWFDNNRPNGSCIMLPNGHIFGRIVNKKSAFIPLSSISVSGSTIRIMEQKENKNKNYPGFSERIIQTFGQGTFNLLRKLKVGVVGCSGTGSIVIEMLARNCVGEIIIVDPDFVEEKNLNRILNSSLGDTKEQKPKVEVVRTAIEKMGLGTRVSSYKAHTSDEQVISQLKKCDVLFGCVDSAIGRYHLDCLSSAYLIPYFDIGVRIDADGKGGISQAIIVAHYIEPGKSSLMSRGAYRSDQVTAEGLKLQSPTYYEKRKEEGYITAIDEDQPAVMSINMQAACISINDFLARVHGYRLDDNSEFDIQRMSLTHGYYQNQADNTGIHPIFLKNLGMADQSYLLKLIS